jgi:hypothetical protein
MRFNNTSLESNEIDANDNNPVLKVVDPAETATEEGQKVADDFEYVDAPEAIDGENQKQEDAIEEGEVLNKITEINNIVNETQKESDTIQAVATIAAEMYNILQTNGKFTPAEALLVNSAMETFELAMPSLAENTRTLPSMESHAIVGLQFSNAQTSMEGVIERLDKGINNLGLNIGRLFKNGVGLANSLTPLFTKQIERATALKGQLNNAHRDAGQKEVTGKFTSRLYIDGKAPDAQTVVKTTAYLNQCITEVLSASATDTASRLIKSAQKGLEKSIDLDNIDHPNAWLNLAIALLPGGVGAIAGKIKGIANRGKVMKQLKMDGNVTPELFKMYPNIAKVNHPDGSNKNLDYRRSLPLFGNTAIVVSQYRQQITQTLNRHEVPTITLNANSSSAKGSIQALTTAQQNDVLAGTIGMLTTAREYYKNYAQRNAECMKAYQTAYNQRWAMAKSITFENSSSTSIALPLFEFYTRMFWRGIFKEQANIAIYVRKTASALIDLVATSSAQAQGGSPSQESIDVNPFIGTEPKKQGVTVDTTENPFM